METVAPHSYTRNLQPLSYRYGDLKLQYPDNRAFAQHFEKNISKAATYNLLQARLNVVLFEIIFPFMCFSDNDQKLWEEDPHEYVTKGYDIIEDYKIFKRMQD
ncbi:unnamed protein product [Lactuca virosa]|uniref:Uncharacterized protein n=1 Tax=Lactuca virosa TaxID=75947 RepID=A0AAU9NE89_9ASTR|nr:unnamed protein product [Lactuca virosa]